MRRLFATCALGLLLVACGGADATVTCTTTPYLLRRDAAVGHCVAGFGDAITRVDCGREHAIEVVATIDFPVEMPFPEGGIPLEFFGACDAGFTDYVGVAPDRSAPDPEHLRSTPVIPSVDAWEQGDRRVVCTARSDLPWSGPVRHLGDLHPARVPMEMA